MMSAPQFNSVRPGIIRNGLYHYYDVGNISCYSGSGTTIVDLMGNLNQNSSTTVFSGTAGARTSNEYFTYNGGNYWTVTPGTTPFVRTVGMNGVYFSIDAWVWCSSTANMPLFTNRGDAAAGYQWIASYTSSLQNMVIGPSSSATFISSFPTVGSGQWRYFAASVDPVLGNYSILQGDVASGVLSETKTYTTTLPTGLSSLNEFSIGRYGGAVAGNGNRISIWRMYNRALTIGEFKNNFYVERARFGV